MSFVCLNCIPICLVSYRYWTTLTARFSILGPGACICLVSCVVIHCMSGRVLRAAHSKLPTMPLYNCIRVRYSPKLSNLSVMNLYSCVPCFALHSFRILSPINAGVPTRVVDCLSGILNFCFGPQELLKALVGTLKNALHKV